MGSEGLHVSPTYGPGLAGFHLRKKVTVSVSFCGSEGLHVPLTQGLGKARVFICGGDGLHSICVAEVRVYRPSEEVKVSIFRLPMVFVKRWLAFAEVRVSLFPLPNRRARIHLKIQAPAGCWLCGGF